MRRTFLALLPALTLAAPAFAMSVDEPHDKNYGVFARDHGDCDHKECKAGDPAGVPEPGTLGLLLLGLGGVLIATRRRK